MTNESLLYLLSFNKFVEAGGIVPAAKVLKISQSTVSAHLSALEDAVGVALFRMVGTRKELTNDGKKLFEDFSGDLRSLMSRIEKFGERTSATERKKFRVGCRSEHAAFVASALVGSFDLELVRLSSAESAELLSRGKIDAALTSQKPRSGNHLSKRVRLSRSSFVASTKLKISSAKKLEDLNAEILRKTPFIVYNETFPLLKPVLLKFGLKPQDLKIPVSCEDWQIVLQLVADGIGAAVVPTKLIPKSDALHAFELPEDLVKAHAFYFVTQRDASVMLKLF